MQNGEEEEKDKEEEASRRRKEGRDDVNLKKVKIFYRNRNVRVGKGGYSLCFGCCLVFVNVILHLETRDLAIAAIDINIAFGALVKLLVCKIALKIARQNARPDKEPDEGNQVGECKGTQRINHKRV